MTLIKLDRKSPRAKFHNYAAGIYFVTICTENKHHYLGKITDGEMYLSGIGKFVDNQIRNISSHYPYADVIEFVVMPNHIHMMIEIFDKEKRTHGPCVPTFRSPLSVVIGGFKSAVTIYARRNDMKFGWQSRYHDHIIRDFYDFNKIGQYIRNNISQWEGDCFNIS